MSKTTLAIAQEITSPIAAALRLDVEDIEIRKTGNRQVIRIILDKDGGISLDEIASATRRISDKLDEETALTSPFTLEVTSPGIDRPLTQPRHWRRNIGRLVKIEIPDSAPLVGRVLEVTDTQVILQVKQHKRTQPIDQIIRAVVQVEFNRPSEESDGH